MFRPEDFKYFAEKLIRNIYSFNPYQEAVIRSSISRSYYYIFLELRETLIVNFPREIREQFLNDSNIHHCLIEKILFEIGSQSRDRDFIKASKAFKYSRKTRNLADYDLREVFSNEMYQDLIMDIGKIEAINVKIKQIDRKILENAYKKAKEKCIKFNKIDK